MPPSPPTPLHHLGQGLAMGTADVIPGVSGGTVALIVGIYDGLVGGIRDVAGAGVALLRGDRDTAAERWRAVPWGLLLPLAGGILLALGLGSVVLPPLLERFPAHMSALFFGLIVGSLPVPWAQVRRRGPAVGLLCAAAAVAAFLLVGLPELVVDDPGLPRVFASAAVAICAMILPGISGAFLLLVLGVYETTLNAARDLDVAYLATFAAGAVVGLGAFARLLSWLLESRRDLTMAALVGLMAGSLRRLWPWGGAEGELHAPPADLLEVLAVVALAVVGLVAVQLLVRAGRIAVLEPTP